VIAWASAVGMDFILGTDIVYGGLKVLFFGLFYYFSVFFPLSPHPRRGLIVLFLLFFGIFFPLPPWKFTCRRPCVITLIGCWTLKCVLVQSVWQNNSKMHCKFRFFVFLIPGQCVTIMLFYDTLRYAALRNTWATWKRIGIFSKKFYKVFNWITLFFYKNQ